MSQKFKAYPGNTYFLTMTIEGWIDLFTRKEYAEFIEENINFCIDKKGLEVFSYCIMPSHLHMIARTEYEMNKWLRDFKGFTSRQMFDVIETHPSESRKEWLQYMFRFFAKPLSSNKEFKIWQNGSHPVEIFTSDFHEQKENYIHNNPVEAGLVTSPEYYRYSSANPSCKVKIVKY